MKSSSKKQDPCCLFPASAVCILIINIVAICFTIKLLANDAHSSSIAASAYPIQIERTSDFENYVKTSDKLLVVFYTASWCGTCRRNQSIFNRLAYEYEGKCQFLTVDDNEVPDVANQNGLIAFPTFDFIKNGVRLQRINGETDLSRLVDLIRKYA